MLVVIEKGFAKQASIIKEILEAYVTFPKRIYSEELTQLSSSNRLTTPTLSLRPVKGPSKLWPACPLGTLHFLLLYIAMWIENNKASIRI